jgi:hypothetical protein
MEPRPFALSLESKEKVAMKRISRSLITTASMVALGVGLPVGVVAYDDAHIGANHIAYTYPTPDAAAPQPATHLTPLASAPMRAARM